MNWPATICHRPASAPRALRTNARRIGPAGRVAAAFLVAAAVGCGHSTYEKRLDETKRYFAYLDRMNQHLSKMVWRGPSVELRVPKQFHFIAPGSPKDKAESERDPRQPVFADITLPGLQGAWEATVSLSGGEGGATAYLYVLSNYELLAAPGTADQAVNFNDNIASAIAKAVGKTSADVEKTTLHEVPTGEAYVAKRVYKMVNPPLPAKIDDEDYRIQIYEYRKDKSSAQAMLVFAIPESVSPAEKLDRAIEMCLETLVITRERPESQGGGGGGARSTKSRGGL